MSLVHRWVINNMGPALLMLNRFLLKAFTRKLGCDWLMFYPGVLGADISVFVINWDIIIFT